MATAFKNGGAGLLGGSPMIFVTVGAQMPFNRLIAAVDEWAAMYGRSDVFAQIGPSDFLPRYIQATRFIDPTEFRKRVEAARLVVAHAGMGSILTALELGKPIIVMPRRGDLKETRNDHQVGTARHFLEQGRVLVAFNENQLHGLLDQSDSLGASERINREAPIALISALRNFIEHGVKP
jgi:UDP-N-acetylglucosamine transferase subunit ALG13